MSKNVEEKNDKVVRVAVQDVQHQNSEFQKKKNKGRKSLSK